MRNDRHILPLSKNKAMEGIIDDEIVVVQYSPRLERRGFGKRRKDNVILHPVEAVYLALRRELSILLRNKVLKIPEIFSWAIDVIPEFSEYYFAYEDLRERGHKIKIKDKYLEAKKTFLPLSERKEISIPELYRLRKKMGELTLAIVDGESDVTYYNLIFPDLYGCQKEKISRFAGYFIRDRVITENKQIFSKFFYGNEKNDIVSLSLVESLYLSEKGFMDVYVNNKAISRSELNELGKKIEYNFEDRYQVYKNLKNRNFSVKTGFKFGSDFRVYDEIKGIEDLPHSKYLISVVGDEKMPLYQIAGSVRLAQNVRKKMIFAFKERGEINYLLIEWVKV